MLLLCHCLPGTYLHTEGPRAMPTPPSTGAGQGTRHAALHTHLRPSREKLPDKGEDSQNDVYSTVICEN